MQGTTNKRLVGKVALGLAVAAVAAPGAQAYYTGDGAAGQADPGALVAPVIGSANGLPTLEQLKQFRFTPGEPTHPFSFEGPSAAPGGPTVVTPDPTRELPGIGELEQFRFVPESQAPVVPVETTGGIDWTDVGIGAGMAIGAILAGAAAALGVRRRKPAHS
jgi:hypothetical protein